MFAYRAGPKISCFLIFDALLGELHWRGVCLCWSLAHQALWEGARKTWPQTFSWSPQNKTGKSWQSVRHRVVTQSVAGNQSLNSCDSSLHHTQWRYTVHKEALSSPLSLSFCLSSPICLNPFPQCGLSCYLKISASPSFLCPVIYWQCLTAGQHLLLLHDLELKADKMESQSKYLCVWVHILSQARNG